jgi:acetyltransferase-like isoleucine patch superfamily enzyme
MMSRSSTMPIERQSEPGPSAAPKATSTGGAGGGGRGGASWYRRLATSQKPLPRALRRFRRALIEMSVPAPRVLTKPLLWLFVALRGTYHFGLRVLVCEPLFKAYCKRYGRRLHTGCFIHWVQGKGDIILGDNVWLDGKSSIVFAARFSDRPVLEIGDNSGIAHDCRLVIGKRITIGRDCNISGGTTIIDSNGHPVDPRARRAHEPPAAEEVRPVVIGDGVWIGMQSMIFPGVKIGTGSVIAAGSVVRTHVPPYSVVAGNPAKVMFRLKRPDGGGDGDATSQPT